MSTKLYVGNLPYEATESDLQTLFEASGQVASVNFYDDLHRRYIEVTGAHGNMLFEPAHTRLPNAWDIHKAQRWLLAQMRSGRLSLDGLVTHHIQPGQIGAAYEGLLKKKDEYLGVVVHWKP